MISPINRDVDLWWIHQLKSLVFCPKLCSKVLFFRKLFFTFCSSHNSKSLVKNSESPLIRYLIHSQSHTSFKVYRLHCIPSKKVSSWCKEELYRFDKECFVKWCTRVDFGVYQNKDKKNLKWVSWGLDIGHKNRNRINSLMFAFTFFWDFFCAFYFPASSLLFLLKVYKHYSSPF